MSWNFILRLKTTCFKKQTFLSDAYLYKYGGTHTVYHYHCNTTDTLSIPSNSELRKNIFVDLTTDSAKMCWRY